MSDILLVSCPPWGVVMPPLGIAYLSTYLRSQGKNTQIYDLNLELYRKADVDQKKFWDLDTINKVSPNDIAYNLFLNFEKEIASFMENLQFSGIIGFSANNLISTTFAGLLAAHIKADYPEKIIILGGPGCFYSWDRNSVAKGAVDFFVVGEGEEVLSELLDKIKGKNDIAGMCIKIPGLIQNSIPKKHQFYPAAHVKDIDRIPFPSFEEFDLAAYNYGKKYRPLPMLLSRGCINRCSYCIDWYMCSDFRVRSPENIVTEIRHHVEKYDITDIEFNDLLCNGNLLHLEKFCDLLIAGRLNVNWISYAAVRKNMTVALLNKMKKAGCKSLCFGIESGSNAVLKKMNKHYTREDASRLIRQTHEAGIEARMNIIVGFPGETEEDFQQTLEFVKENGRFITQVTNVSSFVLMPGSDIAIYPHNFEISYENETDPGTWLDANKTTQQMRNLRVKETCRLLDDLGIGSLIVNYQKEIKVKNDSAVPGKSVSKVFENTNCRSWNHKDINSSFTHKKNFLKKCKLILLVAFSLVIDFYLTAIKKIRNSIIFPGS